MSGTPVQYSTTDRPLGSTVSVLNNNDVVFSIPLLATGGWADYDAFVKSKHMSILMVSSTDAKINDTGNDEGCLVVDAVNGGKKIRDFVLRGLALPKVHNIHVTIKYEKLVNNTMVAQALHYMYEATLLGDMETPVVESVEIDSGEPTTGLVKVFPNKKSANVPKLRRDDLEKVIITAISQNDSQTLSFDVSESGIYKFTGLKVGETYNFFIEMTNSTGNVAVSKPVLDNKPLYIEDLNAFDKANLSAVVKGGSVTLTIASMKVKYVSGDPADIKAQRPAQIILEVATVPEDILEPANYVPEDEEYTISQVFEDFTYDDENDETVITSRKLDVPEVSGLTLKYRAAFVTLKEGEEGEEDDEYTTGSFCAVQSVSVDAVTVIDAPAEGADNEVTGLQLVAYEYKIVKSDNSDQPKVIGKWSLNEDNKELIIAGSTNANSITLSAFDGIEGQGADYIPTVGTRHPIISFAHNQEESPYYVIAKRAIYAKLGDFSWAAFTADTTSLARSKLTLSGSDLKIDGKNWLSKAKASIQSEWAYSDVRVAKVVLADCTQPSVTIALGTGANANKVYGTFTLPPVDSHTAFVAKEQFQDEVAGVVKYHLKKTGDIDANKIEFIAKDKEGNFTLTTEIERGNKNYYSVLAEATRGAQLIGASAPLLLPNLQIVPGAARPALAGEYSCDASEIKSGVLAHAAGVGASFAIRYDGRLSVDQDVKEFAEDHLYSEDYQMLAVQSYDDATEKWVDVLGAQIVKFSPKDAEGKDILKTACFRITGVTGLVEHRVSIARQYALKSDPTIKIKDVLPQVLNFIPTVPPNMPVLKAAGTDTGVMFTFTNGVADSEEFLEYLGDRGKILYNDVYESTDGSSDQTKMDTDDFVYIAGSDSSGFAFSLLDDEGETKAKYLNKTFIYFAGGRSYENPNAATLPAAAFKLMDEQFVNSTRTARVHVNIESGVAELEDVEVLTVYTAAAEATATNPEVLESYSVRFACNAPPAGVSAEVVVYYEADGISKDNSKTYQLAKDKSGKFSYSIDPEQLRKDLNVTAEKFMANEMACLFTAFKEYSQTQGVSDLRRSAPEAVAYTPIMKPTLKASDFSIKREEGKLRVTTQPLTPVQLGGNATLSIKIIATLDTTEYNGGAADVITLSSGASVSEDIFLTVVEPHKLRVVILGNDESVGESEFQLGTFTPMPELKGVDEDKITVAIGSSISSLVLSWKNLDISDLNGWVLSTRRIYVSSNVNNKQLYYVVAGNATTTAAVKTAYKSTLALTETLSGLPIGVALTVLLETVYTKTDESPLVVTTTKETICAAAPEFKNFIFNKTSNTATALINLNGSQLDNLWLFAKYDGVQGQVFFSLNGNELGITSTTKNTQLTIALPSNPKPTGIMGILVNGNGAVIGSSPLGTYGVPAGGSVVSSGTEQQIAIDLNDLLS